MHDENENPHHFEDIATAESFGGGFGGDPPTPPAEPKGKKKEASSDTAGESNS